jgi:hypothetical protein
MPDKAKCGHERHDAPHYRGKPDDSKAAALVAVHIVVLEEWAPVLSARHSR